MDFYISALSLALATTMMAWGVFLSVRIFNLPDITTDGSYTLSASVTAVCLIGGLPWYLSVLCGILAGVLSGSITALIHTTLGVNALLAGILVMTALYSVNLSVMGRSNLPLSEQCDSVFSAIQLSSDRYMNELMIVALFAILSLTLLYWFLKTDFGLALRATGQSEAMAASMGINTQRMKITGLAIANGFTALSAALVMQMQQFADINMGIGIVILGLGSVMMGESLQKLFGLHSLSMQLLLVLLGCLVFRLIMAFTLASGIDPNWMKLFNALVVLLFVSLPVFHKKLKLR
jgi:putative ABC transport system permease protein